MVFDDKFIDELKMKNDIVDVISGYLPLQQKGGNYWGKCPFHHEKTPSFAVNPRGQYFKCFGCGKSGDVITFITEMESLDFSDAVKFLAERVKMPLPEVKLDDERVIENKKKKAKALELLKDTARFYVSNLKKSGAEKFLDYVVKRNIEPEWLVKFGIGASLDFNSLPEYLKSKGYTYQEMFTAGVVGEKNGRYYDALADRLIFPIINQFGDVVAFGGRKCEKVDFGKYKNTGETIVFSKSNNLYNLNNLKKLKNEKGLDGVIIVEGYMDTVSLVQAGISNVVASMGTSLTKDQARILKRYSEKIYISYDGDFAGQKASIRGLEILKEEGLDVKVVALPDGLDPDDVIKKYGKDGYLKLVEQAKPLIDFKIDILKNAFDLKTQDGKRKFVAKAMQVIKESASATEQDDLLMTVRDLTGTNIETLRRDLYSLPEEKKVSDTPNVDVGAMSESSGDKLTVASRFVIASYLFNKPFAEETDVRTIDFSIPEHVAIKEYIVKKITSGEEIKFSALYDTFGEEFKDELSLIAGLDFEENKKFDQATYFFECVKTLKVDKITKNIANLMQMFKEETDTEKRRVIATEMSRLLAEKNKLC